VNYKTECVFTLVEKKRNPPKGLVRPGVVVVVVSVVVVAVVVAALVVNLC